MTTTDFDRTALLETLRTIQQRLADLSYIDHVVDLRDRFYADTGHSGGPFGVAEDVLGTDIPVGREHPFDIPMYGLMASEVAEDLSRYRNDAEAWAEDCVGAMRSRITTIIEPSAPLLYRAIDDLHAPSHALTTVIPGLLSKVRTDLGDWHGQAKHSFDTFIGDAEVAIKHQAWLTEAIRMALAQAKAVIDMGQVGLQDVLEKVADDLDQQLRLRREEARGAERRIDFWLFAGTATGVVSAFVVPGVGQAVLAASSPLLGMVKDKIPEKDHRLESVWVQRAGDYADRMQQAVDDIVEGTRRRWDAATAEGFHRIEAQGAEMGHLYDGAGFEPPLPSMAEGPVDLEDFTVPSV